MVLLFGIFYTFILFFWQWFLHCPNWRMLKLFRSTKSSLFIETYHAPYNDKHRYWTGLLLLVRVLLYIISPVNVSSNPQVPLLSIILVVSFMLFLRSSATLYKKWLLELVESAFYLNIIMFAALTGFVIETNGNGSAVIYTSTMITFALFLAIMIYHIYEYMFCIQLVLFPK